MSTECNLSDVIQHKLDTFYASAFRRQKHYVFRLPVRTSVRPSDQPFLRWPTDRLSVRPSREVSGNFFMRMHRRNGLRFVMLMYPDHLQRWLVFGHGLLIFLILVPLLLVKLIKIFGVRSFYWERMGNLNGMKFGMLVYIDHLQNWLDFGHDLLIFPILVHFDLMKLSGWNWWNLGFSSISGERIGVNVEGERRLISDTLCRVLSSCRLSLPLSFI